MDITNLATIKVVIEDEACRIQLFRPEHNNTINDEMINEMTYVIDHIRKAVSILIIEGLPQVFSMGGDFKSINEKMYSDHDPEPLYNLWRNISNNDFISIAHVRGRVNAGGLGFVAASDMVLADSTATFSLSEMLFGLCPACVLPFLVKKIGIQKAQYLTLTTFPIDVYTAEKWGLVDAYGERSELILKKHILRLKRISKKSIAHYKKYINQLNCNVDEFKKIAIETNKKMFNDPQIIKHIQSFLTTGSLLAEKEIE